MVVGLNYLRVVLQPLFVAIFLFYLATPAVHVLQRLRLPTGVAHLIVLGVSATLLILFASLLVRRVDELGRQLPAFQERIETVASQTARSGPTTLPFFRRHLSSILRRVDVVKPVTGAITGFTSKIIAFLSATVLVVLYLVFLIQERKSLPMRLVSIYGPQRAADIQAIGERINASIARYMYIKFLASVLKAIPALVVMLAFRLELSVLWASMILVLNFIPYFGSIVGFAFPVAYAVLQLPSPWQVVAMASLFFVIENVVGNYWEPRVSGDRLNVSPLVVILALAFWGWLWGAVGLILSVPITVSLRYVLENIPYTRPLAALIASRREPGAPPRS